MWRAGVCVLVCLCLSVRSQPLVFEDNFDELDFNVWKHDVTMTGGGNWEFEMYINNRSVSYVRDGIFYIKPQPTTLELQNQGNTAGFVYDLQATSPENSCTSTFDFGCQRTVVAAPGGLSVINPVQSALVRTYEAFAFRYGRLEVRAKLPAGDWLWPAIWLLPEHAKYGPWPVSGEIDLVESRGNDVSYAPGGRNKFGTTLHLGHRWSNDAYQAATMQYTHPTPLSDDFHTYGLLWTNDSIISYIDDPSNVVLSVSNQDWWNRVLATENFGTGMHNPWATGSPSAPFDHRFYLIFNVAVGGINGYFPDGVGGKPWNNGAGNAAQLFQQQQATWLATWNGEDAALQIDWVRVYSDDHAKAPSSGQSPSIQPDNHTIIEVRNITRTVVEEITNNITNNITENYTTYVRAQVESLSDDTWSQTEATRNLLLSFFGSVLASVLCTFGIMRCVAARQYTSL